MIVLERELQWRQNNERLVFFEPNKKQDDFIKLIGTTKEMVSVFSAANGVGKTALAVNILGNAIWEKQNKYFDYSLFNNWPYPKRARYITDPKLVEEIGPFHSEILKYWPKGKYMATKGGKNYYSQYTANDWVIDVMTYDQEVKEFEGGTLGLILLDEPPPQPIWNASIARLRMGGMILCFMTPLTHAAWFYESVAVKHPEQIIYSAMEDACKEHGQNGHLEHQFIEKMIQEIPIDEVEARVFGKAMYLKGLIYKQFNPSVHVLKEQIKPPPMAPLAQYVDPHTDKPFACIWAFGDGRGDLYILDEWPNEDFYKMHNSQLTIKDYGNIFKDKEQGWNVTKRVIDRHFADIRSTANKKTLREELNSEIGLYYQPSYQAQKEIKTGIIKVRSALQYDESQPLSNLNQPKIFINPNCTNTIKSFQRWSRDPKNGKVQDAYKDFMDVIRYAVMDPPKFEEQIPAQEFKKMWG